MISMTDRIENARKRRKEEQVLAAILHMSSAWGFFALISSGVVWAATKSRSRFLMVQAFQAFLFRLFWFSAFIVMFLLFMAGFYYAAFSGLLARTGFNEPELTSNLIIAWIAGFCAIFFFRFILPLWGLSAGFQILRGKSYQYPILGKAVIRYTSRQPFVQKTGLHSHNLSESENERIVAGLGHAAMFVGFSLFLSPILWATTKARSRFLNHNLLQASLFQIAVTILLTLIYLVIFGGVAIIWLLQPAGRSAPGLLHSPSELARLVYYPFSLEILFVLILLTAGIYVAIAAIQAFRGKEFNYPLIGKWLLHYLQ